MAFRAGSRALTLTCRALLGGCSQQNAVYGARQGLTLVGEQAAAARPFHQGMPAWEKLDVVIPALGESITDGSVAALLKSPGERVAEDEPVVSIETDKVTVDVRTPRAGVLIQLKVGAGVPSWSAEPSRRGLPAGAQHACMDAEQGALLQGALGLVNGVSHRLCQFDAQTSRGRRGRVRLVQGPMPACRQPSPPMPPVHMPRRLRRATQWRSATSSPSSTPRPKARTCHRGFAALCRVA